MELGDKLTQLVQVLKDAQKLPFTKNNAFFSNLTEISETLDQIKAQIDKYNSANKLKKSFIGSDVRHKLKGLQHSLTFQIRLLDTVYISPPVNQAESDGRVHQTQQPRNEEFKAIEQQVAKRLEAMDQELQKLKKKNTNTEEMKKKNKQQFEDLQKKRLQRKKTNAAKQQRQLDEGKTLQEQEMEQMLLKKQFQLQGEDLCLLGDCMFFGFNKEK